VSVYLLAYNSGTGGAIVSKFLEQLRGAGFIFSCKKVKVRVLGVGVKGLGQMGKVGIMGGWECGEKGV